MALWDWQLGYSSLSRQGTLACFSPLGSLKRPCSPWWQPQGGFPLLCQGSVSMISL